MNMKEHILNALREQVQAWEALTGSLTPEQITASLEPSYLSIKDTLAHLHAWQQRSIARLEAGLQGSEPQYPIWLPGIVPDTEGVNDKINAWLYDTYHDFPWEEVHQIWLDGYLHLLELALSFAERDLLDSDRYPWAAGYSLADTLLATYDHHQEHYEKLLEWLNNT
jgi:hypothetical protein